MFVTELFENLMEAPTDVLYHVSSVVNISKILKEKRLFFTAAIGTETERKHQKSGYHYYFSTARSKTSEYIMKNHNYRSGVMKLNGRWFSDKFPSKPIDYFDGWWIRIRKMRPDDEFASRETEDRIMAKKPFINLGNMNEVIKELHFYFTEGYAQELLPYYITIIKEAKINNIPIYFYADADAALIQNKSKAMPMKDVVNMLKAAKEKFEPRKPYGRVARDYTKEWRELYHKDTYDSLSKEAKRKVYDLARAYDMRKSEMTKSLEADIHNDRKYTERADKIKLLSDILRKERLNGIREFIDFLSDKWTKIMEKSR
jgi:hypothetical protein